MERQENKNVESWIAAALGDLDLRHEQRHLTTWAMAGGVIQADGRTYLNFASNDYLDLLKRPELKESAIAATQRYGTGSGASRLVSGSLPLHDELEAAVARHKGYPAALVFGSGYMANMGVIPALAGRDDVVLADRLIHASLIDAIRLSGAKLQRFRHNDLGDLEQRLKKNSGSGRKLIVTESVFSMDGDIAPLKEIAGMAAEHEAMLLVDEAHATGVFGPAGRGLVVENDVMAFVTISMSTFSKALGGYGGVVGCSNLMRRWLVNKARAFIYTTAPPPAMCGAALAALRLLDNEPDLGNTLLSRAAFFRELVRARGFNTGASASQIVPVLIGDNAVTMAVAEKLRDHGIIAGAIRPPTVPPGTARLRFSITLAHRDSDLEQAADILARVMAEHTGS